MFLNIKYLLWIVFFFFMKEINAQVPQWDWVKGSISNSNEYVNVTTVDSMHNCVYFGGGFISGIQNFFQIGINGTCDFTTSNGGTDGFLAKYDLQGNFIWAIKYGGSGPDFCSGITVTPDGTIYICGETGGGGATFSGTNANTSTFGSIGGGGQIGFIASYTSSGQFNWVHYFYTNAGSVICHKITSNNSGIFVAGEFQGTTTFDNTAQQLIPPTTNTFTHGCVIKYNFDGTYNWAIPIMGDNYDKINSIKADSANVYAIGITNSKTISIATTHNLNNANISGVLLMSISNNGTYNWGMLFGSNSFNEGQDLDIDKNNIYCTGSITSNLFINGTDFSGTTITDTSLFISKHLNRMAIRCGR